MSRTQLGLVGGAMMFVAPILTGNVGGAAVAHADALSEGCAQVNLDDRDGSYAAYGTSSPQFFSAGEAIVAQAGEPTSFGTPTEIAFRVSDEPPAFETVVVDVDAFPGTVSYVVPADGIYHMSWTAFNANATWTVNCTAPSPPPDEDGDSVPDSADLCPGTVPDSPTEGLRGARFALTGTTFDSGMDQFDGMYTIADTAGCSGAQIVELRGLGAGHLKHGISKGALEAFIASL